MLFSVIIVYACRNCIIVRDLVFTYVDRIPRYSTMGRSLLTVFDIIRKILYQAGYLLYNTLDPIPTVLDPMLCAWRLVGILFNK